MALKLLVFCETSRVSSALLHETSYVNPSHLERMTLVKDLALLGVPGYAYNPCTQEGKAGE